MTMQMCDEFSCLKTDYWFPKPVQFVWQSQDFCSMQNERAVKLPKFYLPSVLLPNLHKVCTGRLPVVVQRAILMNKVIEHLDFNI